jgi:hypothetical protein
LSVLHTRPFSGEFSLYQPEGMSSDGDAVFELPCKVTLAREPIRGPGSRLVLSSMTESDLVTAIVGAIAGPVRYYRLVCSDDGMETLSTLQLQALGDQIDIDAIKRSQLEHVHARRVIRLLRRAQLPWYRVTRPRQRRGRRAAAAKAAPAPKVAPAPPAPGVGAGGGRSQRRTPCPSRQGWVKSL